MSHPYVIVGGGLAAASAVEGIREHDPSGPILMLSRENHAPYHRPPLSKGLWFGKDTLDTLPVHDDTYYREHGVELRLRHEVVEIDPEKQQVWDDQGGVHPYGKLLIATGGRPRRLNVRGDDVEGVHYYRDLEDFLFLQNHLEHFEHALVVGGGFIGMEIAAALNHAGKDVTLLYRGDRPLERVLPRDLGAFVADYYRQKGIETVSNDSIVEILERGGHLIVTMASGGSVTTELVLVGVGLDPETDLADAAGLEVDGGILVDEYARTTDAHIWAAGDATEFPDLVLGKMRHVEHWDHAMQHGRCAGANMAGANQPYDRTPFFYSDLFELGWEAVGDVDARLDTEAVWREPHREGVIYYLQDDIVRGVLLWNVWERVEWARALIREAKPMTSEERSAAALGPPVAH